MKISLSHLQSIATHCPRTLFVYLLLLDLAPDGDHEQTIIITKTYCENNYLSWAKTKHDIIALAASHILTFTYADECTLAVNLEVDLDASLVDAVP